MNEEKAKTDGSSSLNSLYKRYAHDAKKRSYEFNLTKDEFTNLIRLDCEYCGVPPYQVHTSHAGYTVTYNGIDRVNPKLGYTVKNSVPCCGRCNLMKLDMTKKEFIRICYRIVLKSAGKEKYKEVTDNRLTKKERRDRALKRKLVPISKK